MFQKTPSKRDVLNKIRAEIQTQITKGGAPEEVHGFLLDTWSRLLVEIFLAKGNQDSDWNTGWETVHALLWSLAPKRGREETTALLRMLPTLLQRLHAGCAALGMALPERDALFERLAMLHAALAREGLQARADDTGPVTQLREADASDDSDLHTLSAPELATRDSGRPMPTLRQGDRVIFMGESGERPLLLTWLSPMGGMYLFANDQGYDAISLTHARLEAKFQSGEARLP
jgi:hypothetical protein